MTPEREKDFEDDKIIRWIEPPGDREQIEDDPTVLSIDAKTEEIYEGRTYVLGSGSLRLLAATAAATGLPLSAVLEFGEEMGFKFMAKRRRSDGMVSYIFVFSGLGERHLLGREDWVTEERYRASVREFEDAVLPGGLVNPPLVIGLEEWRRYERGEADAGESP